MLRLAFLLAAVAGCTPAPPATPPDARPDTVLVFTRTEGYRHASIETGVEAVRALARARGLAVEHTEDPDAFSPAGLAGVGAVVFLSTSGDVLDADGEAALRDFVASGGGWLGIHAASDTEHGWPWYGDLVGAYFESHPAIQEGTVRVADADHPATRDVPAAWVRTDEWYSFGAPPPAAVRVLLRLDASTVDGTTMGDDHPLAWAHAVGDGRALYTALGHTAESYAEPLFLSHLDGALCWVARLDCAR